MPPFPLSNILCCFYFQFPHRFTMKYKCITWNMMLELKRSKYFICFTIKNIQIGILDQTGLVVWDLLYSHAKLSAAPF